MLNSDMKNTLWQMTTVVKPIKTLCQSWEVFKNVPPNNLSFCLSNLPNHNSVAFLSLLNLNSSLYPNVTLPVDELTFITLGKTDKLRFGRLGKAADL